jgi:hypothetical protein
MINAYLVSLSTITKMAVYFSGPDGGKPVIRSRETVAKGQAGI